MKKLETVSRYGRWSHDFRKGTASVRFTAPSGRTVRRECFDRVLGELVRDEHGYETIRPTGETAVTARFTPTECGIYAYETDLGERGTFLSEEAGLHGYVRISEDDPRYFRFTDGTPFFVIGMNLASLTAYTQSSLREFGLSGERGYLGTAEYERWFRKLSEAGGNHARIWLGQEYLCVDTEDPTKPDLLQFEKLDRILELARKYGIYLKLSFDHFRFFGESVYGDAYSDSLKRIFGKRYVLDGEECASMTRWIREEKWRSAWKDKIRQYLKRYGGDPIVFCFELWNEMNAVEADYGDVIEWNRDMARSLIPLAPENMWCQSLGSMDSADNTAIYDRFPFGCFSFSQFHRYLDQGAKIRECREDGYAFTKSGIEVAARPEMPVLLAETGAVNDCHSGPFRYYMSDDRGVIFADTVYPAAFLGAAGCGQIWHWGVYAENKGLFSMLKPLAEAFSGVDPAREAFTVLDLSDERIRAAVLKGRHTVLGFLRNRADGWAETLRDGRKPEAISKIELRLDVGGSVRRVPIWEDESCEISLEDGVLRVKRLTYGVIFRIDVDASAETGGQNGGRQMKQLAMIRKPQSVREAPLPEGCTVRTWKDENDTEIWVAMCKEGILAPDADRGEWERLILSNAKIRPERDVFFFDLDGRPAATVTAVMDFETKTGTVHMVDSFPWARGRGVGNYMMNHVLSYMVSNGMEWIKLTTDDWRIPAIKSYLKNGFCPVNVDTDMEERWTKVLETIGAHGVEFYREDRTVAGILCP